MAHEEDLAIQEESGSGGGCPVKMGGGRLCGRPIHQWRAAIDPTSVVVRMDPTSGVCLMHSIDPGKDGAKFQREFEAILEAAGNGVADFTRFVFPIADCVEREFKAACVFESAIFRQDAQFRHATFTRYADFSDATFEQKALFSAAKFTQYAEFSNSKFTQVADFDNAKFAQQAYFRLGIFAKAFFAGATFGHEALFYSAKFAQDADFRYAEFTRRANFTDVTFTQRALLAAAKFTQTADFSDATFRQEADFSGVTFEQDALFNRKLSLGGFAQKVSFEGAKFLGRAEFRGTQFWHNKTDPNRRHPGPVFSQAEFAQPEKAVFYKNYLGQALFYNCDVSRVNFSLVTWGQRRGSGKWMVFEEEVDLEAAPDLGTEDGAIDERRYWLIIELYQQLKKNYDERKDYGTAGDFHYGELEMKRLATPQGRVIQLIGGKILGQRLVNQARRWWHRYFSLVALYKYASQYGESYARSLLCLALVLLLFTFLFPIVGLDCSDAKTQPTSSSATHQTSSQTAINELSYGRFSDFVKAYPGRKWLARPAFFGHSFMTALSVAGFQKELKYEPSYPWGRALALLELLLTSTLAALFLLAVRRQFRR